MMNIKLLPNDGDVLRVEIVGNVTRDSWTSNCDPLAEHCGAGIYGHAVLLSLRQSLYVDSSGVDWLINCHRRFQKQGGRLVLHSLTPATNQLLKMMRLDRVLQIELTESAARLRIDSVSTEQPSATTTSHRGNGTEGPREANGQLTHQPKDDAQQ